MALIEANRLTVTIPTDHDNPPSDDIVWQQVRAWLEQAYGYPPPTSGIEGFGWSAEWQVGNQTTAGWRFDAVIPRHLGPARSLESPAGQDSNVGTPPGRHGNAS